MQQSIVLCCVSFAMEDKLSVSDTQKSYHLILHFGAKSVISFVAAGIIDLFQLFSAQHEQESVGRAVSDLYSTHTKHTHAHTHCQSLGSGCSC